jgi:AcrR family transcriptional regulator
MPSDAITTDTRSRILQEAERLFRVYGYAKTTVSDIATACDMSPSNVYRFFPSKSAINDAICDRIISESERRLFAIAQQPVSASERIGALIVELHRNTMETLLDQKKVSEMVVAAMDERWHAIEAHIDRVNGIFARIIEDGIASGEFRAQDPLRAAECTRTAMASLWHPVMVSQCFSRETKATPEEMAAFVLAALKACKTDR